MAQRVTVFCAPSTNEGGN